MHVIKRNSSYLILNMTLVRTAFRNFRKSPSQLWLNIFGLALGFATMIYIASYVNLESSFDSFHSKADRIYRCVAKVKFGETEKSLTNSELPIAASAKKDLPEIEDATRIFYKHNVVVKAGSTKNIEDIFWYADENFFQVFDFKLLEGERKTVLSQPNSVVITKEFSRKYFGDENPVGKNLEINGNGVIYQVTGILGKIPTNSHIQFSMLASFSSLEESKHDDIHQWGNFPNLYTYFLVRKHTSMNSVYEKFRTFPISYYKQNFDIEAFEKQGNYITHNLQPLKKIHLDKTFVDDVFIYGNKELLLIVGIIGIFIIIIASVNFVNLSTAQAALRAIEIGIKKIFGSTKNMIIMQVLMETLLQCSIALVIAVIMLLYALPVINKFVEVDMRPHDLLSGYNSLRILAILIVVVLLSGIAPSFMITRFNPLEIVKGTSININSKSRLRSTLVTFQFVIFIALICCAIIIKRQVHLFISQNPGFNKEDVLVVKNTDFLRNKGDVFKNEMLKTPGVINASYTSALPSKLDDSYNPFSPNDLNDKIIIFTIFADNDFLNVLKIRMVDGRFFSDKINEEQNNAVINEKAAKLLGWRDVKNRIIHDYNDGNKNYNIIGIVADFHIESLKQNILPIIIKITGQNRYLTMRIQPLSGINVLQAAERNWNELYNNAPFEYFFLDKTFDSQYKMEIRLGKLVSLFTVFSIIIACLGLVGLVSYTLNRKQKEIGIRKINGAKVSEILTMLNIDFVLLVTIAFTIACPIVWILMHKWLQNFVYKTDISWWIFILAGLIAMGLALITISWQSWQAAKRNPVDVLRQV